MRWYHWLWIPFVAVTTAVAYYLGRRRGSLKEVIGLELDVLNARAEAKRNLVELDAVTARHAIEVNYAETIKRLDEEQKNEADKLRNDPAAHAEYLVRAGYGT